MWYEMRIIRLTSDYDVMVLFTFPNSWASKRDWGEYSNVMDVTDPVYRAVNDQSQWAG